MILKRFARIRTYRAATNAEAFKKVRRHKVAAVVSDLIRPGGDGFEFLKQFRMTHATVPVIISSGNDTPANRRRAKRLGAFAFLPKGYRCEELVKVVMDALTASLPVVGHHN
jgi:DNA-binding NtrC family response regulator